MDGLNLEPYLMLRRTDLGGWAVLGGGILIALLLVRASWGSRRLLRKCLVFSLLAHAAVAVSGSRIPAVLQVFSRGPDQNRMRDRNPGIRVQPVATEGTSPGSLTATPGKTASASSGGRGMAAIDFAAGPVRVPDVPLVVRTPAHPRAADESLSLAEPPAPEPIPLAQARVDPGSPTDPPPALEDREDGEAPAGVQEGPVSVLRPEAADWPELPPPAEDPADSPSPTRRSGVETVLGADRRLRPPRPTVALPIAPAAVSVAGPAAGGTPERLASPERENPPPRLSSTNAADPDASREAVLDLTAPLPLPRVRPEVGTSSAAPSDRANLGPEMTGPPLAEVPPIYRSRLDTDRSLRAVRAGATAASEQAVERALDWLARHQDPDGRWDGGVARYDDGTPVADDDDFTVHCPPGQTCFGECAYWEADTALTALALLAYLGAGYTHTEGRFSDTVSKGIDFLLAQQKRDGDLRGGSRAVGIYGHAMATLALCEAYALSLDERLKEPASRALAFLVSARARDGQAWRYLPGARTGDTSILGWVVMALKSAREIGLPLASRPDLRAGILRWLDRVAAGQQKGLARYQPWEPVTPTMTAEAWVCRQFLGTGGPGPASSEAAESLLKNPSDRGNANYYYWYYATLAMYQHGGQPWTRWNAQIRDRIVRLQRTSGHQAGSWDPDDSPYGVRGGRIYSTTLAALTLEVYYRYLRLYDPPSLPAESEQP